jgi:hypothetical protein
MAAESGIDATTYQQGKEIAGLQATVELQGKTLGASIDLLREEVQKMRGEMTTKDDLKNVTLTCPECPKICGSISRIEIDLYGKDSTGKETGRPGLVTQVGENSRFIANVQAYWAVILTGAIAAGFLIAYVLPRVFPWIARSVLGG